MITRPSDNNFWMSYIFDGCHHQQLLEGLGGLGSAFGGLSGVAMLSSAGSEG